MTKPSLGDAFRKQKKDAAEAAARAERAQKAAQQAALVKEQADKIKNYFRNSVKNFGTALQDAEKALGESKTFEFKNIDDAEFYDTRRQGYVSDIRKAAEADPAYKKMHALCRQANVKLTLVVDYVGESTPSTDPDWWGYQAVPVGYVYMGCRIDFDKPYQAPAKPAAKGIVPRR